MFEKWFNDYGSIVLFGLCWIFISLFRKVVVLYLLAKFSVLLVEGIILFLQDLVKTLLYNK